jgi:D-apiose dehydrogenase
MNTAAPLRVAMVGAGFFAQHQIAAWRYVPGAQVVAVCDQELGRAQTMAHSWPEAKAVDTLEPLLQAGAVDLIDIATPPAAHHPILTKAIEAGVPCICQKPFTKNLAQAKAITQLASQAKVALYVHENFRFMPWYRAIRSFIQAGMLGAVHNIAFRLRPGDGQGPQAYLDRQPYFQKLPRLLVMETGIHFIDTFRYLVGEVSAVYARLRKLNPHIQGEDAGYIVFEFENGVAGLFDGNRLNDHSSDDLRRTMGEMWLEGELGVLRMDGHGNLWFKPHLQAEVALSYDRGNPRAYGFGACEALQNHIADCLRKGAAPEISAAQYLRNLVIQEAVYASHVSGQRVVIDDFESGASAVAGASSDFSVV